MEGSLSDESQVQLFILFCSALEKQDEAVGASVWNRVGILTLRGCKGFVLEGRLGAGPSWGAAWDTQQVSGRHWDGEKGRVWSVHQEPGLQSINFNVMQIGLWKC